MVVIKGFATQDPTTEGENWSGHECLLSATLPEVFIEMFIKQTLKNILLECSRKWPNSCF